MSLGNHYRTLEVDPDASVDDIKRAYRRLVKMFHPDVLGDRGDPERIININAAYEILSDPDQRFLYDQKFKEYQLVNESSKSGGYSTWSVDGEIELWLRLVYQPVNDVIDSILIRLDQEIRDLSADPGDDDLMGEFELYIKKSRAGLDQALSIFNLQANPRLLQAVALNLYYCLNQLGDGLEELLWFTKNYHDHYLHTGQELFRLAEEFQEKARRSLNSLGL